MDEDGKLSRRAWLAASAAAALPACSREEAPSRIVGANFALGHRVRERAFPASSASHKASVVIVGAGVTGLAAARRLRKLGVADLAILELESQFGGNSQSGANHVTAYPWGAHYLPLPGPGMVEVLELLRELGAIVGEDARRLPIYREEFLVADPQERLYRHGLWQEGLVPTLGVTDAEAEEIERFLGRMEALKLERGADGRRLFALPLDESSRDPEWLALDRLTMAAWMDREGFRGEPLRWYVNYCCLDDYGIGREETSAWAGLHYFCSRDGQAANAASHAVLTWPEGNGWLVRKMAEGLAAPRVRHAVWNIEPVGQSLAVDAYDDAKASSSRWLADVVIFAAPRFLAPRIIRDAKPVPGLHYAPWMVANLFLKRALDPGRGAAPAWDNVLHGGPSLGYVVATHQHLVPRPAGTALTYYQPIPASERALMLTRSATDWRHAIVADLARAHPDLSAKLSGVDVWLWGHGMISPTPGFLWGEARRSMQEPLGRVLFAHSDMSGISIFEEAYRQGTKAADRAVGLLGKS